MKTNLKKVQAVHRIIAKTINLLLAASIIVCAAVWVFLKFFTAP